MTLLIGVHGKKQAGKDTICHRLMEMYPNKKIERRAFADPLKDSVCALFGISRDKLEAYKVDESVTVTIQSDTALSDVTLTMRDFLQNYGTEAHRGVFGTDFWLDETLSPYEEFGEIDALIVTDVRFPNEAERIREMGGEIWHVVGKDDSDDDEHESEVVLSSDLLDFRIYNLNHYDNFRNLDMQVRAITEKQVVLG